ncbi:MAG: PAS domain S-box protein [Pseudomonadota bacterium]|nr:PAS domain S-box protein [Pseudomonadota bacterium]
MEELLGGAQLARAVADEDFKHFLDHVPIAIAVWRETDKSPRVVYFNPAFEAITGAKFDEMAGKTWEILAGFQHEDHAEVTLARAAAQGEDFLGTFRRDNAQGAPVLAQAYVAAIENEDGTENYRVVALVDISHHGRSEREAYEGQIRDKDLLLRELQHRVKNNLQLITALIRLEARSVQRGAKVDLERLAGRIEALSLLYQTLTSEAFAAEIDLGHYISQIASASMRVNATDGLELELRVGYAPASVNVAMPAGLIVNELLLNAFKYAFTGRERGRIAVEVRRDGEDHYFIAVADDGVGLPAGATWPLPGKLAALVLQALRENTKDLAVKVESKPGEGTRLALEFRHLPPSARKN